jgi:Mor family transcriptional regulator
MAPMSFLRGSTRDDSVIAKMAAVCDRALTASGVPKKTVNRAVVELVSELRRHFGGGTFYIPKGRVTREERAAEVHARHAAGESIAELVESYGFTPMYIGGLIRQKDKGTARRQRTEKQHG